MEIRIAGVVEESFVDGPGIRFAVFVQGCPHHCENCHNPETHDFSGGCVVDTDSLFEQCAENPLIKGVTFSGGEPFCQPEPCAYMAEKLKASGYHLMAFTGYTFEKLLEMSKEDENIKKSLNLLDVIIDGKFILAQRSLGLRYKGSKNQRTIDVKESIKQGRAVEIEI